MTDSPNKTTSYSYDNMDRVASRTDPLFRQESYLYDANGNLRQVTDRKNQVTGYSYDSLDRLTLVTYADYSTTSYSYDNGNRLTQVVDSPSVPMIVRHEPLFSLVYGGGERTSHVKAQVAHLWLDWAVYWR